MPPKTPAEATLALRALADRWRGSTLGEQQASQHWFLEFCDEGWRGGFVRLNANY